MPGPGARFPLSGLCLIAVACACAERPTGVAEEPADVGGTWTGTGVLESASPEVSCADTGRVELFQDGETLNARAFHYGTCFPSTGEPLPLHTWAGDSSGSVRGRRIQFSGGGCTTEADVGADGMVIDGHTRCLLSLGRSGHGRVFASGTWRMHRSDFLGPTLSIDVTPSPATHGDTLVITIGAKDSTSLDWIAATVAYSRTFARDCDGVAVSAWHDTVAASGSEATVVMRSVVPPCTEYGVEVTAAASDTAGNVTQQNATLLQIQPPTTTLAGGLLDSVITGGDTARITVSAENVRGLSWIGVRSAYGDPWADSVRVNGTSASHEFRRATPSVRGTGHFAVSLFARHTLGHLTTGEPSPARLTDAVRVPARTALLPRPPGDMLLDRSADVIYLTDPVDPVLRVMRPAAFETIQTIALAAPAAGLDLSISGDSLLLAHRQERAISILVTETGARTTIPLELDTEPPPLFESRDLRQVRVVAGGRVLLGIASGSGGYLFEVDLGTGILKQRSSWTSSSAFERSADRTRAYTDALAGLVYLAVTDEFFVPPVGGLRQLPRPGRLDVDAGATAVLVDCQAFTTELMPVHSFEIAYPGNSGVAISPDGRHAYCLRRDGVDEFDVSSGAWTRAFRTPSEPTWIRALSGQRLIVGMGASVQMLTLP